MSDNALVTVPPENDAAIRAFLTRIARPHASGGQAVERATLLAEGAQFPAIMSWITEHAGIPEASRPEARGQGLHGALRSTGRAAESSKPLRYVLPAGTLA